jgi:hypothetical protein
MLVVNLSLFGMTEVGESSITANLEAVGHSGSQDVYVPQNIDVTCCLAGSAKLCYMAHGLCKFGVGLCEVASLVCSGVSVLKMNEYPEISWGLSLASVITNVATLGLTYSLFKTESKVRKLDQALGEARANQAHQATPEV